MEAAGWFPDRARNISVMEGFPVHPGPNCELSSNQDNNGNEAQKDSFGDPSQSPANLWKVPNPEKDESQEISLSMKRKRKSWLCRAIAEERPEGCIHGRHCRFNHDIQEFLATRPPDLGDRCVFFETFGKCPYGVACLFSGAHLGEGYKNLVNVDLWKQWEGVTVVKNRFLEECHKKAQKLDLLLKKSLEYISSVPLEYISSVPLEYISSVPNSHIRKGSSDQALAAKTGVQTSGTVTDEDIVRLRPCEKQKLDVHGKLYLSPLEEIGKVPFRRLCKRYGADITCAPMVTCDQLFHRKIPPQVRPQRHHTEDVFGVQLVGKSPTNMIRCAELFNRTVEVDFVDVLVSNPNDVIHNKDDGSKELDHSFRWKLEGMNYVLDVPLTVKLHTSLHLADHKIIPSLQDCGVSLVTLYVNSEQKEKPWRDFTMANWSYIAQCAKSASPMPVFGNGGVFSFEEVNRAMESGVSGVMIARAALIKPWIFTEIKEQRHWDISARERLDMLNDFVKYNLEFWGSDEYGVEMTRVSLLEWLPHLCKYIPVGTVEHLPPKMNDQRPKYVYGDYLENLMASEEREDWIKISNMFLRPTSE